MLLPVPSDIWPLTESVSLGDWVPIPTLLFVSIIKTPAPVFVESPRGMFVGVVINPPVNEPVFPANISTALELPLNLATYPSLPALTSNFLAGL